MTNTAITSESGLKLPTRTEAEYRADLIEALKAEGNSDFRIAQLTSDETVKRMVAYENRTLGLIAKMFGGGE